MGIVELVQTGRKTKKVGLYRACEDITAILEANYPQCFYKLALILGLGIVELVQTGRKTKKVGLYRACKDIIYHSR